MAESPVLDRVRVLVAPIVSDLQLDLYDIEQRGGTLRVTLDTPAGAEAGIDLEQLALATRLISRELDHTDPIPGRYTLEVSSPGVERPLRTPEHFARVIGEPVTVRLVAPDANGQRRFEGRLVAADATTATVLTDTGERTLALAQVERAKTVFEWGPAPKPGKGPSKRTKPAAAAGTAATDALGVDDPDADDFADDEDLDDADDLVDEVDELADEATDAVDQLAADELDLEEETETP
ncbi:MAG TPA: ribosome maturation factor RimP [Ilumatobacter sp.]|nr:ribosome maturation factor RimP [Ilumatobacter sp.]